MKFIKSSKIGNQFKMHFPKDVAKKLGLKEGDFIHFYENDRGEVVIKKA